MAKLWHTPCGSWAGPNVCGQPIGPTLWGRRKQSFWSAGWQGASSGATKPKRAALVHGFFMHNLAAQFCPRTSAQMSLVAFATGGPLLLAARAVQDYLSAGV